MSEFFSVGKLTFELRRSEKRKSIGITIERDGVLLLTAPFNCPMDIIERTAQEKQFWIYTKLAEKNLLAKPQIKKDFVTGEGFYYLGRSYRLLLTQPTQSDLTVPLRLHQGRFMLNRAEIPFAEKHFISWYTRHALPWLNDRVNLFADRLNVTVNSITVQNLGYRWGSCSLTSNKLNFHWRTILLPPRIIEYVIVHEMIHLLEPHHNQNFWQRLERVMPDFTARKRWLAENGASY